jgi:hypothetical protein
VTSPPPLLERAYELARSGRVETMAKLLRALTCEGYEQVEDHIGGGSTLRRELTSILRKASIEAGNGPAIRQG